MYNTHSRRYQGWSESEEGRLGNMLLNAYDEGDQDAVDEILKKQRFKYLDNNVCVWSMLWGTLRYVYFG